MKTFEIYPYLSAGNLEIGMSADEIHALLGNPMSVSKDADGETIEEYENIRVFYSSGESKVAEITFMPKINLTYNGNNIFEDKDIIEKLIREDTHPKECFGFIVFLKLGIALADFHTDDYNNRSVSVFENGRWDDLKEDFVEYSNGSTGSIK